MTEQSIIIELSSDINDHLRQNFCARHLHHVDRERGLKDSLEKGYTYCNICGVKLEWREEGGIWEM